MNTKDKINGFEVLTSCCNSSAKVKIEMMRKDFKTISTRIDWMHYLKRQHEFELMKKCVFKKDQLNLMYLITEKIDDQDGLEVNFHLF